MYSRRFSDQSSNTFPDWRSVDIVLSILQTIAIVVVVLVVAFASGCAPRTVFVNDGSPARIGRATGTVWVNDGQGWVEGKPAELPEGWYIVSPRWVEEDE